MGYKRKQFEQKGFDESAYKKYFHQKQSEYIRKKLRCILLYHQGKEFDEISTKLSVHHQSVRKYISVYINGGFKELCQETIRPQSSQLSQESMELFKATLLSKRPFEVGLEGNIWTGKIMCQYLQETYNVRYKSGIYDLLDRLDLTHQKAHADYGNAKPSEQIAFINELKSTLLEANETTAVVKFDEFSIGQKPSAYYGWAEKNTRPTFITDEKKEIEPTGF